MSVRRSVFAPSTLFAALAFAPIASAEPAPDPYGRLVTEALTEYDGGRFEEALTLFEQAYAAKPSARAERGMAKALFELRAYVRCIVAIDDALAGTVDPLPDPLRSELRGLRERAARFVGRVAVAVVPPGANVVIDGRPLVLGSDGTAVLEVGPHVFEVSAPDHRTARRSIDVRGGKASRVAIDLEPIPAAGGAPRTDEPSRVMPVALLMTAGALSVAGVVVSSLWFVDRNSATDRCADAARNGARCDNGESVVFQRNAALATIALSSVAIVASGVGLFFALRDRPHRTAIACGASPNDLSCGLTGAW